MARSWTIGSNPGCDLVVRHQAASGRHCRLTIVDVTYLLEDLESANGTYVNGERITDYCWVTRADYVTLGPNVPIPWPGLKDIPQFDPGSVTRIGRGVDNDLVVSLPTVSTNHALVVWRDRPGEAVIQDLASANGTFVNGRRVEGSASTRAGDVINLGTYSFVLAAPQGSPVIESAAPAPPCWWARTGRGVVGPLSVAQLRGLARSGEVSPETPVSRDKLAWLPAARLKGLFKGNQVARPVPAPSTGAASGLKTFGEEGRPTRHAEPSSDGMRKVKPDATLSPIWPMVRVQKASLTGRQRVTRLRPDGLSFRKTSQNLTEAVLTADDGWEHIPVGDIRVLRVEQVGYVSSESLWLRFRLESAVGVRKFRVPVRDSPNLLRGLKHVLGDRINDEPTRRMAVSEKALVVLATIGVVALAIGGLSAMFVSGDMIALAFLGLAFVISAGLGYVALKVDRRRSEFRVAPTPTRRQRRRAGRRPFRSPALGWGLKVGGVFYMIYMMFSGIPERILAGSPGSAGSVWLIYLPGLIALVAGYRLCLRTFDPVRHPDPRPPVLFLRSFDDDGKMTFQPRGWLAGLHGIFRFSDLLAISGFVMVLHPAKLLKLFLNRETYTAEELLGAAFRRCGPFVAIGRPGEMLATAGADRMYVRDDSWQKTVLDYLKESQSVVLQPAQSEGVRWEIEHVLKLVPRHRVLLSLLNFKDRPNLFEDFREWLAREYGVVLRMDLPFRKEPMLAYFDTDGTLHYQPVCYRSPLLWTFVGNAVDNSRTFDAFIRGLRGGPRDAPSEPKKYPGHAALSVPLVVALLVGFSVYGNALLGTIRYRTSVANDVVFQQLKDALPAADALKAEPVKYIGRAVPYELKLDPEWKPLPNTPGSPNTEYFFDYRDLGKLEVTAGAGPITDLYDETLAASLRETVETTVRKEVPDASVKVLGTRWVSVNGVQWREVSFEQNYGSTLGESRRMLFYSGQSGWASVTIILPIHGHYARVADDIVATLRAPKAELDEILESAEGAPVTYRGKKLHYRLELPPAWQAIDLEISAKDPDESGKKLSALLQETSESRDYNFVLGTKKFADLEVLLGDSPEDIEDLESYFKAFKVTFSQVLGSAMPDFKMDVEHLSHRHVTVGGRKWGEIEARVLVSKNDFAKSFKIVQRVTNHEGRAVYLTAQILKEHPDIRKVSLRALDSFRFDE